MDNAFSFGNEAIWTPIVMAANDSIAELFSVARKSLPRFTDRLPLGAGGLRISPFCLGMVASEDAASCAFDAGINFFFISADMHWPMYEEARRGIRKLLSRGSHIREQIVIASVSYATQLEFCHGPHQELLNAMPGLERIDLLIAGGAYGAEFMNRLGVYVGHRSSGFLGCRAIGATFHDRDAARLAINHDLVDVAFIRYNSAHPGALVDVLPHLNGKSRTLVFNFKSTLGYVPKARFAQLDLGKGCWHPKITDHYRFVLTRPGIHGLLCSLSTPGEIASLAEALEEGPLNAEQEEFLIDVNCADESLESDSGEEPPAQP
jgi:hypothetical protein